MLVKFYEIVIVFLRILQVSAVTLILVGLKTLEFTSNENTNGDFEWFLTFAFDLYLLKSNGVEL